MIAIEQRPDEASRTGSSGCAYVAEAVVEGRRFTARSRHGAPNALARVLVDAGIEDQPVEVRQVGLAGAMRYCSFHKLAGRTYTEGNRPVQRIPYAPTPDWSARLSERGQNGGESPSGATPLPHSPVLIAAE